jgi:hypothetical protein
VKKQVQSARAARGFATSQLHCKSLLFATLAVPQLLALDFVDITLGDDLGQLSPVELSV